jgi:ABC-type uncharacterized transport system permease subunit
MSILVSALLDAPVSASGLWLGALTAVFYAAPALGGRWPGATGARRLLVAAWVLHALLIGWMLVERRPLRFGFAPALSVTAWLMLTVYVIESRFYPQMRAQRANPPMRWLVAAAGVAVVALALLFPGELLPDTASALLPLHGALGISAYGLFAAAVAHALILSRAEARMRHAALAGGGPESGLPLLTQERLMFGFVWAGFALLTLTLVAGALFGEQLYGGAHLRWIWDHKRVFTALSWLIFAALLLGRRKFGWRGRRATRALYAGAAFLLLGYAGSRFVLEVLLGRLA